MEGALNLMPVHKGIKLRFAISLLVIMTLFFTILVNWYTSTKAIRSTLTENYLEENYKYAYKLSLSTGDLLNRMQLTIDGMAETLGHKKITQSHLDEHRAALGDYFNSLFIVDAHGVIQFISPSQVEFNNKVTAGMKIQSETMKKALSIKQPFISDPYVATSGQLIMLISAPIFDKAGTYQGLVAGTIYLESGKNAFNRLLNEHENANGSYVYVVDHAGHIIFHHDTSRINENVSDNEIVKQLMKRSNGSAQIMNDEGEKFFAGYAYEKNTEWGIVSQTPTSVIEGPVHDLLIEMFFQSLPLLLLILIIAGILTNNLSKPLNRLAKFSEDAIHHKEAAIPINSFKIKSHIYEVRQLYHQIYDHFQLLNNQIQLDGLTGIANRRTFDIEIKDLIDHKIPFTMIMIDIDRFKKVNDTYGHLVGDDVLRYLSSMIDDISEANLCYRYGGEEFGVLVKDKNEDEVFKIAEQLRIRVAETVSPTGGPITISIGISSYHIEDQHPEEIIKRADTALFQSKSDGRNKTTIYNERFSSLLA